MDFQSYFRNFFEIWDTLKKGQRHGKNAKVIQYSAQTVRKVEREKLTVFFVPQLTVIVSASQGILFAGSQSHFETLQQNASGYESIEHQLKMHITDADLGRKNVSGNSILNTP